MRKVDSKDFWYFGMASVILSFVTPNFFSALGLLMAAGICLIFYIVSKEQEKKAYLREQLINGCANDIFNFIKNLGNDLEKETKRPSRRKPMSRNKRK